MVSCDQITTKYSTYQKANEAKLFDKGWIPNEIINPHIKEIFLKTNLDLNSCIFSFNTNYIPDIVPEHIRLITLQHVNDTSWNNNYILATKDFAKVYKSKNIEIQGINIPSNWFNGLNSCQIFGKISNAYIAYDTVNKRLYGWKIIPTTIKNIITKNLGKYPYEIDLFGDNSISNRINKLTGDKYQEIVDKFNVQSPISYENGVYIFTGCKQHDCPGFFTTLIYDADEDNIHVIISINGNTQLFFEKRRM